MCVGEMKIHQVLYYHFSHWVVTTALQSTCLINWVNYSSNFHSLCMFRASDSYCIEKCRIVFIHPYSSILGYFCGKSYFNSSSNAIQIDQLPVFQWQLVQWQLLLTLTVTVISTMACIGDISLLKIWFFI